MESVADAEVVKLAQQRCGLDDEAIVAHSYIRERLQRHGLGMATF